MALPLAPVNAFEEGLQIIQEEADLILTEHPAVLQFTVYLRRVWLPLKEKISVFGRPIRTNNIVESFHHVLFQRFGCRVRRVRNRHNVRRNKRIAEAQDSLISER